MLQPLPQLALGFSYGEPIHVSALQLGDYVKVMGTPRRAGYSGEVTKISRVNVNLLSVYFDMPQTLKVNKFDFAPIAYARRGNVVHPLTFEKTGQ